jgi:hypothetical protein
MVNYSDYKSWYVVPKTAEEARIVGKWFDGSEFGCLAEKNKHFYELQAAYGVPHGGVHRGNVYNNVSMRTKITFQEFITHVVKQTEIYCEIW